MSKRMCQSIFVSAIESALFPVGCLCVYLCVRVRHRTDLSPGGWLSCFRVSVTDGKDQGDLTCLLLEKHNITTGKVVNGIIFGHLVFLFSDLSNIVPLKGLYYYYYYYEKDQQLTLSFQSCL